MVFSSDPPDAECDVCTYKGARRHMMPPVWQHTRSSHICKSMFLSVNAVCNAVYKRTFVHSIQASFELVSENLLLVATRYGMIRFFSHSVYVFSKHAPDIRQTMSPPGAESGTLVRYRQSSATVKPPSLTGACLPSSRRARSSDPADDLICFI